MAIGGAIGILLSFLSAQLLGSLLFGVTVTDPVSFILIPAVLAAVAFLSAWIPARRAGGVSLVESLRSE